MLFAWNTSDTGMNTTVYINFGIRECDDIALFVLIENRRIDFFQTAFRSNMLDGKCQLRAF